MQKMQGQEYSNSKSGKEEPRERQEIQGQGRSNQEFREEE